MNIIITAGGTVERIDNVRKITNMSTGKTGKRIAEEVLKYSNPGDNIFYICTKQSERPSSGVKVYEIEGVLELQSKIKSIMSNYIINYFVHSMAISDYRVDFVTNIHNIAINVLYQDSSDLENLEDLIQSSCRIDNSNKISSDEEDLVVIMKKTPKIISMIKELNPQVFLVGFKLLDNVKKDHLLNVAYNLLNKNKCDIVIANDLSQITDACHPAMLIYPDKSYKDLEGNDDIAENIASEMFER